MTPPMGSGGGRKLRFSERLGKRWPALVVATDALLAMLQLEVAVVEEGNEAA
jgi:hypothetical protein